MVAREHAHADSFLAISSVVFINECIQRTSGLRHRRHSCAKMKSVFDPKSGWVGHNLLQIWPKIGIFLKISLCSAKILALSTRVKLYFPRPPKSTWRGVKIKFLFSPFFFTRLKPPNTPKLTLFFLSFFFPPGYLDWGGGGVCMVVATNLLE